MDGFGEKKDTIGKWWPAFIMDTRDFDFGLTERNNQELNKVVYKAVLQYAKDCSDAQSKMIKSIQEHLKSVKF